MIPRGPNRIFLTFPSSLLRAVTQPSFVIRSSPCSGRAALHPRRSLLRFPSVHRAAQLRRHPFFFFSSSSIPSALSLSSQSVLRRLKGRWGRGSGQEGGEVERLRRGNGGTAGCGRRGEAGLLGPANF